ncbi:MAG TPA: tetratricopeptide repeat protein, partial [Acidimicrobiales bacterium]|nr:tetratricopeptide repeat protein [Acidimicrobiales bacterium]
LGAMTVKGKSAAIAVRRLVGRRDRREPRRLRSLHPLVGRSTELDDLVGLADEAFSGRGQVVGLSAEAGMGKTSLTAVLSEIVEDRGVPVLVGAAVSAGGGSYLVWRDVMAACFGLGGEEAASEIVARVEEALGEAGGSLRRRVPLLAPLLGVAIDDNELTAGFDAKLRKTSLESLIVQYLSWRAARGPVAIVLEDCHWIDPLSSDLLDLVARVVANLPVLLVTTYRPGPFSAPALGRTTVVELDRLDDSSCREILVARLRELYGADRPPATPLVERLVARAEGNPFYLGELANYLHAQDADPTDASAGGLELPSSLSSLVLSRIDTLGEGVRRTLKVASVIGRDFDVATLAGAYPTVGASRQVLGHVRTLVAEDLVVAEDTGADRYTFRHAVIQEVAYESLPFALRATVHGHVGAWLESAEPDALDLLAHHFWLSREEPKKREYLRRAGVAAAERYANDAAAGYFRRLAPLVDGAEREDALKRLGAVLEFLGAFAEAGDVYHEVLEIAERRSDPRAIAWAHVAISEPMQKQGRYTEALAELDVAEQLFEVVGDDEGRGRVPHIRGVVANRRGKPEEAWAHLERSLEIRRPLGDQVAIATTLHNLGVAAMRRGDLDLAQELTEQSLELRLAIGDKWHCSGSYNNLGWIAFLRRDYALAIPHFEEAVRIATEIGASWTVAMARGNLANSARELGDVAAAREHYAFTLDTFVTAGDLRMVCVVFDDVAQLCAESDPAAFLRLVATTDVLREQIGAARMDDVQRELDARAIGAGEALGEQAAAVEHERGRVLDYEAAVDLCRELCKVDRNLTRF